MSNIHLPPITKILPPGKDGANEFARIVQMLLDAEAHAEQKFTLIPFNDSRGDINGADAILNRLASRIYVQIKYYPRPFTSPHRHAIKEWFEKHVKNNTDSNDEFWLITPDDPMKEDAQWLLENFDNKITHLSQLWLDRMFLKHTDIGRRVYQNHNFDHLLRLHNTPDLGIANQYFRQFLDPTRDITYFLSSAQPTLYDCRQIFTEDWAESFFDFYSQIFLSENEMRKTRCFFSDKTVVSIIPLRWHEFLEKNHGDFPGGMKEMAYVIRPETIFYSIVFKKENEYVNGYKFRYWCFINGRWVFFIKPYRVWRGLITVRNDVNIKWALRLLRLSGIAKDIKKVPPFKQQIWIRELLRKLGKT